MFSKSDFGGKSWMPAFKKNYSDSIYGKINIFVFTRDRLPIGV